MDATTSHQPPAEQTTAHAISLGPVGCDTQAVLPGTDPSGKRATGLLDACDGARAVLLAAVFRLQGRPSKRDAERAIVLCERASRSLRAAVTRSQS